MTHPAITKLSRRLVTDFGWRAGTSLEDKVTMLLHRYRFRPDQVAQQHRVGRYRLDFAWPALKVALEADGWHHRSPEGAAKDAARDAWLRSQGWLVFRVHDEPGDEVSLNEQVARVAQVIRALT